MKLSLFIVHIFIYIFFSNSVYSKTIDEKLEYTLQKANNLHLEKNSKWHQLIHYEKHRFSSNNAVISPSFFLSSTHTPKKELSSTIISFFKKSKIQCRFPARLLWLKKRIPKASFPEEKCLEYQTYLDAFKANNISIIYASGYLGNPASMYGHVLLKFNQLNQNELLDNTYSYGARISKQDNKLTYIYKGITGGYKGHFSNQKYHNQTLTYNESEMRDLWEYRLKLPQDKVKLLLAHLWELKQADMTYYFFTENCAYQLAKLLELVIDKPLISPRKIWVMPYDLIMMLNKPGTKKYINKIIYHGSRQQKLYEHFSQLNNVEKKYVKKIIQQPATQTKKIISNINSTSAKKIIDTLYDYYDFVKSKNKNLSKNQFLKRKYLLSARFQMKPEKINWKLKHRKPPHQSQNTALVQISSIYNTSFGLGQNLRFRANYYDKLNINTARIPYSTLTTFDLNLLYVPKKKSWSIREFTLFNIENFNISQTELPEDKSYAWSLRTGYKPTTLSCINCSDPYISGFWGKGIKLSDTAAGYLALSNEIQFPDFSHANLLTGPEIGGVLTLAPYWVTSLKIGTYFHIKNIAKHKNHLKWEQRFLNKKNMDLRTSVQYDESFEYAINFSLYW